MSTELPMTDWNDLSNDELFARLVQKGLDNLSAMACVSWRDDRTGIKTINSILGEE